MNSKLKLEKARDKKRDGSFSQNRVFQARKMPNFSAPKVVYKSERILTRFCEFHFQTEERSHRRKSHELRKVRRGLSLEIHEEEERNRRKEEPDRKKQISLLYSLRLSETQFAAHAAALAWRRRRRHLKCGRSRCLDCRRSRL